MRSGIGRYAMRCWTMKAKHGRHSYSSRNRRTQPTSTPPSTRRGGRGWAVIDRKEVEEMLSACERDRIGPHPSNETLAALCRAWLALDGAVAGDVECSDAKGAWLVVANDAPLTKGQRVRIVPEAGQEVGSG